MAEVPAAVELRQVTKSFGDLVAVREMDLTVWESEFFSLLGPSGCGKTTTLRLIAGFEIPTSGAVLIGGDPQGYRPAYKRPVNTVFQNYALFPHMSVYQNVAFGLEMQNQPKDDIPVSVSNALEMVQLPGFEKRKPNQLSGGQQQRVALARALINRPKVLLLDEPLGALDLKLRKAMQLELKELQHRLGITFIYVTHDQEEAITMSDRIAVVSEGQIQQIGEPEQIYESPANRFVADFIGETNLLPGVIRSLAPQIRVELPGGLVMGAGWAQDGLEIGNSAVISIRPEKIELHSTKAAGNFADGIEQVNGIVDEVVYLGTDTRHRMKIHGTVGLVARQQNVEAGGRQFTEGEEVVASWDATHARLLRE